MNPRTMMLGMLVLAGAADVGSAKRSTTPPVAVADGPASNCIQIVQIRETRVRDDQTIDFFVNGRVYRNTLPHSCPELGFEQAFSYETSLSELCSTDIITVFHNGIPRIRGASCGLGSFQPVTGIR